jgi:hypothetical protein
MSFDLVRRIADAILLEGYVLYPYRATSAKNRFRWTFGVLAPARWASAGGSDSSWLRAELLVSGASPRVHARLRFLSVIERRVEAWDGARFHEVSELEVGGQKHVTWEEGELFERDFDASRSHEQIVTIAGSRSEELLADARGATLGRVMRTRAPLEIAVGVHVELISAGVDSLRRVTIRVENVTPCADERAARAAVMRSSVASAHFLVRAEHGLFVSLLDPPAHAREAVRRTNNVGVFPVLAGDEARPDVMLASPIILYDHPKIAPESTGDFFDAAEIDELLALRTQTLTPDEKAYARATDARAAAIIARADGMSPEEMARLHGTQRPIAPDEADTVVTSAGDRR